MSCENTGFLSASAARNIARNRIIYEEICAIQHAILTAIDSCVTPSTYEVVVNGQSPITSSYGIRDILVPNQGTGYTSGSITLTDVNGGSGFIGELVIDSGAVTSINIIEPGQNYSSSTIATITGDGNNATAVLIMDSQKWMSIPYSETYYRVYANLETNRAIDDQIEYIQNYFTNLGYNFQIRVNPTTMNTLQWQLMW